MDHTEAIMEIKNVIDKNFINKMIPFINHTACHSLETLGGVDKNIRNVKGYPLYNFNSISDKSKTDVFYHHYVKKEITRLYTYYKIKFPQMASTLINQVDLLKYKVGNKYNVHVDNFTTTVRTLSIIMNLNDTYEGGDLIFTDQKEKEIKRLKLGKGSIVFFPSNFMYPHIIEPITKGTRYSIVAWLQ